MRITDHSYRSSVITKLCTRYDADTTSQYSNNRGSRLQCHAIVLGETGATYTRQQPRYIEREKKRRKREKERIGKTKKAKKRQPIPVHTIEI